MHEGYWRIFEINICASKHSLLTRFTFSAMHQNYKRKHFLILSYENHQNVLLIINSKINERAEICRFYAFSVLKGLAR